MGFDGLVVDKTLRKRSQHMRTNSNEYGKSSILPNRDVSQTQVFEVTPVSRSAGDVR